VATGDSQLGLYLPRLLRHGTAYANAAGELHLTLPERIPYIEYEDTEIHVCGGAEYLHSIVVHHYKDSLSEPLEAVEVIAQFQPDPIIDYSVPLPSGYILLLPPSSYFHEVAYGQSLTETPDIA
jgi:hypothetical protein